MRTGTYVVTGVGGFVGSALARALLGTGCKVVGIARGDYPELVSQGVKLKRLDLADPSSDLVSAVKEAEGVFHVAAKVDMWGRHSEFVRTNVEGTRAIIRACQEAGVSRLVFTSSPSVIADGKDLIGVNESYPYPAKHMASYPETKAMAEREVLAACREGIFHTVSLRPHLIFGPGDQHFIPTIVARARAGRLVQIGAGKNLTDLTFIADCVRAHLCAMEALDVSPACRGRAYFISQGEPVGMWEWIQEVLRRSGLPAISRSVPKWLAMSIAGLSEGVGKILPGSIQPPLTRFLVSQMSTSHYFDISAAGRDLSFFPRYSMREAMDLTFPGTNPGTNPLRD